MSFEDQPDVIKIEIRPGESTEKSRAEAEARKKQEEERTKDFTPADYMEEFIRPLVKDGATYSETLIIRSDGSFDDKKRADQKFPMAVNYGEAKDPDQLYALAKQIQDRYPEYSFDFTKDPEGRWMRYTVKMTS